MATYTHLLFLTALLNVNAAYAAFYIDDNAPLAIPPGAADAAPNATLNALFTDTSASEPLTTVCNNNRPCRRWTLTAGRSLRDNMDTWIRNAGYEKLEWRAARTRQIAHSAAYTGPFADALQWIADRTPELDFIVSKSQRTLRVVDATP